MTKRYVQKREDKRPDPDFEGMNAVAPYEVQCARCGCHGMSDTFVIEEGDEWECPECWDRIEAQEAAERRAHQTSEQHK